MVAALDVYIFYRFVQKSSLDAIIELYKPYKSFKSVFMSEMIVNIAGEHTILTSHYMGKLSQYIHGL